MPRYYPFSEVNILLNLQSHSNLRNATYFLCGQDLILLERFRVYPSSVASWNDHLVHLMNGSASSFSKVKMNMSSFSVSKLDSCKKTRFSRHIKTSSSLAGFEDVFELKSI